MAREVGYQSTENVTANYRVLMPWSLLSFTQITAHDASIITITKVSNHTYHTSTRNIYQYLYFHISYNFYYSEYPTPYYRRSAEVT